MKCKECKTIIDDVIITIEKKTDAYTFELETKLYDLLSDFEIKHNINIKTKQSDRRTVK